MNHPPAGDPRRYCVNCRYRDVLRRDSATLVETDRCTHEINRDLITGKMGVVSCEQMRLDRKDCGLHGELWEPKE